MQKLLLILVGIIFMFSCKNESKSPNETGASETVTDPTQMNMDQSQTTVNIPAGPDGVVHHYICADKCVGGHSPNPGTCPVCGKTLAHNQAFHDQQQQSPAMQTDPATGGSPAIQAQQPPQNESVNIPAGADGKVHHYICTAGCKGGHSENAGNCPVCGKTLAHNQAWHNQ